MVIQKVPDSPDFVLLSCFHSHQTIELCSVAKMILELERPFQSALDNVSAALLSSWKLGHCLVF